MVGLHSPTLTAVRESSSDAREPPCLLLMLILLLERVARTIALRGRWRAPEGEPGGEAIDCRGGGGGGTAVWLWMQVGVRSAEAWCRARRGGVWWWWWWWW